MFVAAALGALACAASAAPVTFKTADGWTLSGWYQPPQDGRDVVVLVHNTKSTSAEWRAFARSLQGLGLGTLAFDLRGYGKSLQGPYGKTSHRGFTDMDWPKTVKDVDAAVDFLKQAGVPESRIALAGSIVGANVVAMAAQTHPDAAWLFLLSPSNDYHGLSVGLGGRLPTLLVAGQDDEKSLAVCRDLLKIDASRDLYVGPDGRGVALLKHRRLDERVLAWIVAHGSRTNGPGR
jgi:pimeloyl-ACP methyl ester carboxylesterase